jgi:hypothetical protein
MKARVSHLHRTEADWASLIDWAPAAGEMIVYDPDENHSYARIKIGDGKKSLRELPFFIDAAIADFLLAQKYQETIDGGRITDSKK